MLLFSFVGFLIGFALSLRFVRRPRLALIWGLVLGVVPLALMLGPAMAPVQGIGSALNFFFFALGPLMLTPFVAIGAAFGVAGAALALWVGRGRARWIGWATGGAIIGIVALLTVMPVAQREIAKRQATENRDARSLAIMKADFKGTLGGHNVVFPASPLLSLVGDCVPETQVGSRSCTTSLVNPISILTKPGAVLLSERSDPINFRSINVSAIEPDCRLGDYCLTQENIDHWCSELRADQANSIWCLGTPPMRFWLRTDAHAEAIDSSSNRGEPNLAARYADTPLGPGHVSCFYAPNPTDTDRQGVSCMLTFKLADRVKVALSLRRSQIISSDPALAATIALIPDYWAALTGGQ